MDFGNNSSSSNNKSPVLTIKRGAGRQKQGQWQDFIDREHSTVDHLLQDSFATFCSELSQKNQVSSPKYNYHTLDSNMRSRKKSRNSPEKVSRELEDVDGLHLPPGIAELENLYAPMKNLSHHLPSNQNSSTSSWRQIEPFKVSRPQKQPQEIRDDESEVCSVIIPPPLAPVQSHSILEMSRGRPCQPPQPPRSQKKFPNAKIIYANLNRRSLMSTGSSEESTLSEILSPTSVTSTVISDDPNFRSVSQTSDRLPACDIVQAEQQSLLLNEYADPQSVIGINSSRLRAQNNMQRRDDDLKDLLAEINKKRQFRIGLNLFNSKPELGIEYLSSKGFIELSAESVAKFLFNSNGLSLEKIGDYLSSLQSPFAMKVLYRFMQEFNFSGQRIDKSLRLLLKHLRICGEAQQIEKIMEVFGKRYAQCNPTFMARLKASDSVMTLAFAVILLNTDLHSPTLKSGKKMNLQDFITNLRGVDAGRDFEAKLLKAIYKSIKRTQLATSIDHAVQVQALQNTILNSQGKPLNGLAEPHRRLVCICRLSEVTNLETGQPQGHQRDLFLFNDLLLVTKMTSKATKNSEAVYTHKASVPLKGLKVTLFQAPNFSHGLQIVKASEPGHVLATFNASTEHDRYKFVMDLQESILEMDQTNEAMMSMTI